MSTRLSVFEPIENYKEIIDELEESYDFSTLGMSRYLIDCSGSDKIVVVIYDCMMANYFEDESDLEGIADYLKANGNNFDTKSFFNRVRNHLIMKNLNEVTIGTQVS